MLITAPVAKKLKAFALRLHLMGQTTGATCIGADRYDIEAIGIGFYRLTAINGKEPEPRRLCQHEFYEDACPHCAQQRFAQETKV